MAICRQRRLNRRRTMRLLACTVALLAAATPTAGVAAPGRAIEHVVVVPGARLHVSFDAAEFRLRPDELVDWVHRAGSIVAGYYGTFPLPEVAIRIRAVDGGGVRHGQAFAGPGIRVNVGREVSAAELLNDWVLVHEMTHLALPQVGEAHAWLSEGLATYVEGIARVQAGNLDGRELWREDVAAMPKGLPAPGDQGLDHTHTWGRTYWGGALFCLTADVAIRERSGNTRGLQDALRAILRESGGMNSRWPIERVLEAGDAATGTSVLAETYRAMRDAPSAPDLAILWQRLGLSVGDGVVRLETGTVGAAIRDAITAPRAR